MHLSVEHKMRLSEASGKRTYQLLHSISDHLSGRAECKQQEYVVCIGMDYNSVPRQLRIDSLDYEDVPKDRIFFHPDVRVFPNVHDRKQHQLEHIIDHVITRHFPDSVLKGLDDFGHVLIEPSSLTPGVYRYALSRDGRRRSWIQIR